MQLPWTTHQDEPWPKRKKHKKKKTRPIEGQDVTLQPSVSENPDASSALDSELSSAQLSVERLSISNDARDDSSHTEETESTVNVASDTLTTSTPEPVAHFAKPAPRELSPVATPQQMSKAVVAPVVPALPKESSAPSEKQEKVSNGSTGEPIVELSLEQAPVPEVKPVAKPVYKNWADMARGSAASKALAGAQPTTNGLPTAANAGSVTQTSSLGPAKSAKQTLADVLQLYRVKGNEPVAFLEPRGLHNSAVDCYINSVSPEYCIHCPKMILIVPSV